MILWSTFTALTGAAWSAVSLLVIRFLFGAGEAGAFPGATRAFYGWLPAKERGFAQGIFHSGARLGAAASLFLMPALIHWIGWRWTFVANGAAGILWGLIWLWWFRDDPAEHRFVNRAELDYIRAGNSAGIDRVVEDLLRPDRHLGQHAARHVPVRCQQRDLLHQFHLAAAVPGESLGRRRGGAGAAPAGLRHAGPMDGSGDDHVALWARLPGRIAAGARAGRIPARSSRTRSLYRRAGRLGPRLRALLRCRRLRRRDDDQSELVVLHGHRRRRVPGRCRAR